MILASIHIFDWNGTLVEDLKGDGETFSLKFTPRPDDDVMGFLAFTIEGSLQNIRMFCDHYEIEVDDPSSLGSTQKSKGQTFEEVVSMKPFQKGSV